MRRSVARIKGIGFIVWHARHEFYHILWGLVWAWYLRERWNEFNPRWIWLSIFGSLVPDIDHVMYFLTYGKFHTYTTEIKTFLKNRQWRALVKFMENGHKYNTNLSYHNYYFVAMLLGLSLVSSLVDWEGGVIVFGAMIIHYVFDLVDDMLTLGYINSNWKRWGRNKGSL
ncbi:MAG: hypothetical protein Q7S76_04285 [bacterium]|nr:hypothetical protein [bacterium]